MLDENRIYKIFIQKIAHLELTRKKKSEENMKCRTIFNHHLVLGTSNLIFSICGVSLLLGGFYLYTDTNRILLSRLVAASSDKFANLPHPFFYYIALGLAGAGLVAIFASIIGWWATCLNTYCILSIYFLVVILLLLIEFSTCVLITVWPQCLGIALDETLLVKALQGSYGVPGKEQLTAAIDMAQTKFQCCAINSNINYDTSLWRLQGYGQRDWPVPQSCCHLNNRDDINAYLDPKPVNLSSCQSLQRHVYENARHTDGCLDKLDNWYRKHYFLFLGASVLLAVVEFGVLLSIILSCTKLPKKHTKAICRSTGTTMHNTLRGTVDDDATKKRQSSVMPQTMENIYMDSMMSDQGSVMPNDSIKEVYVRSTDAYKNRNDSSIRKPGKYHYQISKSYLV